MFLCVCANVFPMPEPSHAETLKRVSIFSGLEQRDLVKLAKLMKSQSYPKNEHIIHQDQKNTTLFVIVSGKVKVVLYSESGHQLTICLYRAGDFFGELSLLDGKPSSASVVAVQETVVLKLERQSFLDFLHRCPPVAMSILPELAGRIRHATTLASDLAFLDVYSRVGRLLQQLAAAGGEPTASGIRIKDRLTQEEIASLIGCTREMVWRGLKELRRQGFISLQSNSIVVHRIPEPLVK